MKLTEAQLWYQQYLKSSHWQHMRKRAFERYGRRCSVIHCRIKKLNIHHLSYQYIGEEREINDIRPLCWWHHFWAHRTFWGFRKIPLNRKHLINRYIIIKRFHWRSFRFSDILKL